MFTFLSVIYVFICLFLILVVLLQSGKGGGIGSLGGGTSQQVFGGAGAGNILTRMTAVCAFLFMALAITLEFLSTSPDRALDRALEAAEPRGGAAAGAVEGDRDRPAGGTPPPAATSEPTEAPAPAEEEPSEVPAEAPPAEP